MRGATEPTMQDLEDPLFLKWLDNYTQGKPVRPVAVDFDPNARLVTAEQRAEQYRLAHSRAMVRLWRAWKAGTV